MIKIVMLLLIFVICLFLNIKTYCNVKHMQKNLEEIWQRHFK